MGVCIGEEERRMNSWTIIKNHATLIGNYGPGTLGRMMQINGATDLFLLLKDSLTDREEAIAAFDADEEISTALQSRSMENALRDGGVLPKKTP